MKKNKRQYLSYRITILFGVLLVFMVLLLLAMLAVTFITGRFFIVLIIFASLLAGIVYGSYKWVYIPYRENTKVLKLFGKGYLLPEIFSRSTSISPEMDLAIHKFKEMFDAKELISSSKRQAQYLALQNQINPHFLYNTLEGIRGETMQAGLDNVSKMTEALATFFRYTISNVENLVTLEEELTNIENYYIIQHYRFGKRLSLKVQYDTEEEARLMQCRLPKLTLQPIVENAIYHGLERKMGAGTIRILIEATPKRLIVTVSDDGLGMPEKQLVDLNNRLNQASLTYTQPDQQRGGIAMVNVNSRIQLLFGEDYGIHVYSTQAVGTDVEITLPFSDRDFEVTL